MADAIVLDGFALYYWRSKTWEKSDVIRRGIFDSSLSGVVFVGGLSPGLAYRHGRFVGAYKDVKAAIHAIVGRKP